MVYKHHCDEVEVWGGQRWRQLQPATTAQHTATSDRVVQQLALPRGSFHARRWYSSLAHQALLACVDVSDAVTISNNMKGMRMQ
jgi:hypothetical protein